MRVVAFVPAKGESSRIRNKNTVILDGEYLFKRKLRQLLECPGPIGRGFFLVAGRSEALTHIKARFTGQG